MSARHSRIWLPHPLPGVEDLQNLHVWTTVEGYVLACRQADGTFLAIVSTSTSPDASGVPAGTRRECPGLDTLLRMVPPRHGLLVDGSSPGRRVVPADQLDRLRWPEPPFGDEEGLRIGAVPARLRAVAIAATRAAREGGAARADTVWAESGCRRELWVCLSSPTPKAFDAAYTAVAEHAPREAVRILDVDMLPYSRARSGSPSETNHPHGPPPRIHERDA